MTNTIIATTSKGLDELLKQEITQRFGSECSMQPGMIKFQGELNHAYELCLWSRLSNRVIWLLHEGKCDSAEALYATASQIDWAQHLTPNHTLSVNFVGTNRAINNTQFGAVKIKDAIVDQFMEEQGSRPSIARQKPDVNIYARCIRDHVYIGIDLAGESLHQRAYRQETGQAPLKEHLACAMLMRSGWCENQAKPLIDPMCGAGTIAIEAAYMARNIAPGLKREYWGFEGWLQHNAKQWDEIYNQALSVQKPNVEGTIFANDISRKLVAIARKNADEAGVFNDIQFTNVDALKLAPPVKSAGYLVSNPPYGERLGELAELIPLFAQWGTQLKAHWQGWQVTLLSSNRDLLRILKLRGNKDYAMNNGKLECRLVNYSLDEANCQQFGNDATNHEFANRLRKNLKKLSGWIKKQQTDCYRIYDADLPDYNVAIDRYGDWLVVQEYAPPKNVDLDKARRRLQEVLLHLPAVTGIGPKNIVLKVREQQKGTKQYQKFDKRDERMQVYENGAKFWVNLHDYLDTGLFLDHRITRQIVAQRANGKDVLNLFAYTGSVSVFAAKGGARSVTTVDLSNTYLNWARDNFALNKLQGAYQFIQDNCVEWLQTHTGKYDLIFIDPPSFSNSKRMQTTWDVQRDHVALLTAAHACLKPGGEIIFSNNRRGFKIDNAALQALGFTVQEISQQTLPEDFARNPHIHKCWTLSL